MSGGHFDYNCFNISQFADDLKHEIEVNDDTFGYIFNVDTLRRLKSAHSIIETAGKLAKEIEWLYSGDHGEDSFAELVDVILENK